jgi:hypothetical protein
LPIKFEVQIKYSTFSPSKENNSEIITVLSIIFVHYLEIKISQLDAIGSIHIEFIRSVKP